MKHKNVSKLIGYGNQGTIKTPEGKTTSDLVYSTTLYTKGMTLADLCKTMFNMGESYGKFIFDQILNILEKLEENNICHRNLSLKSFIVDTNLNLKLTDFVNAE